MEQEHCDITILLGLNSIFSEQFSTETGLLAHLVHTNQVGILS